MRPGGCATCRGAGGTGGIVPSATRPLRWRGSYSGESRIGRSIGHRRPAVGKARSALANPGGRSGLVPVDLRAHLLKHIREPNARAPVQHNSAPVRQAPHTTASVQRAGGRTSATDRRTEDMLRTRAGGRASERLQGAASVGGPALCRPGWSSCRRRSRARSHLGWQRSAGARSGRGASQPLRGAVRNDFHAARQPVSDKTAEAVARAQTLVLTGLCSKRVRQ